MTVRTAAVAAILALAGCAAAACSSPSVPPAALGGVAGPTTTYGPWRGGATILLPERFR